MKNKMRIIALEEHYMTKAVVEDAFNDNKTEKKEPWLDFISKPLLNRLCDLDDLRISEMDAAGIDIQVLSLTAPGVEQMKANKAVDIARDANDFLAAAVRRHPDRFAGLATLPIMVPDKAAEELERMIREHGFKGAVINGHTRGRYLDDEFFWPILERAERLRVPIYLHPTQPPQPVVETYYKGNFSPEVAAVFAIAGWGWHIETATHILRLILSGAFDRFPELQFIVGHMGEALPFMLQRIDSALTTKLTKLNKPVSSYLRENIHYTFSSLNYISSFLNLLLEVGVDRIMFSVDYPYCNMDLAASFLEQLPISPAERERIAHGNAENLLRV
jgi:uncharacterized protein